MHRHELRRRPLAPGGSPGTGREVDDEVRGGHRHDLFERCGDGSRRYQSRETRPPNGSGRLPVDETGAAGMRPGCPPSDDCPARLLWPDRPRSSFRACPNKPSRALGISALVIALVPVIAWAVVAAYPAVFPAPGDSFGWLFLVAAVLMVVTPICAVVALILGIVAVRRNRGHGAGMAASGRGSGARHRASCQRSGERPTYAGRHGDSRTDRGHLREHDPRGRHRTRRFLGGLVRAVPRVRADLREERRANPDFVYAKVDTERSSASPRP